MRKLLPLLLLISALYAGWFYWQRFSDRPLQEPLLPVATKNIRRVIIQGPNRSAPFSLTRTENGWVVVRANQQILDQSLKAAALVERLTALQTDSISYQAPETTGVKVRVENTDGGADELTLHQPPGGMVLATIPATGDVFYLNPGTANGLIPQLSFDYFREPRLLNLTPNQVDSVIASYHDSLLWRADTVSLPMLAQHLLAPAAAPFADFFDEIAHQDRYYADLDFYFSGKAHRIQVFQDSIWPQPYVLVGEDFPRRYLGFQQIRVDTLD